MSINFNTTFHTGQNMMIQDFGNGVTAHADLCSGNVKIMDNGEVYRDYKNISLRRFDMVIIIAAKRAKEKGATTNCDSLILTSKN